MQLDMQTDSDTVDTVVSAGNVNCMSPKSVLLTALLAATGINAIQSNKDKTDKKYVFLKTKRYKLQ